MSNTTEPDSIYTITERNYNILQTQISEIQSMLMRRDHYILVETAMDELASPKKSNDKKSPIRGIKK